MSFNCAGDSTQSLCTRNLKWNFLIARYLARLRQPWHRLLIFHAPRRARTTKTTLNDRILSTLIYLEIQLLKVFLALPLMYVLPGVWLTIQQKPFLWFSTFVVCWIEHGITKVLTLTLFKYDENSVSYVTLKMDAKNFTSRNLGFSGWSIFPGRKKA